MGEEVKHTLILGIGNDILSDDGIGPHLVNDLSKEIQDKGIEYMTAATGGMDILELLCRYEKVIIIDAIKTRDGIPGTVYHLTPSDFRETLHISNFHDISFLTALNLGQELKMNVPEKIDIIAVEIIEDLTFDTHFSVMIEEKYPTIFKEVCELVKPLL